MQKECNIYNVFRPKKFVKKYDKYNFWPLSPILASWAKYGESLYFDNASAKRKSLNLWKAYPKLKKNNSFWGALALLCQHTRGVVVRDESKKCEKNNVIGKYLSCGWKTLHTSLYFWCFSSLENRPLLCFGSKQQFFLVFLWILVRVGAFFTEVRFLSF